MNKYIDLSHKVVNKMIVHPYDDEVKLRQDKFLDVDKYNNFRLETGMHAGTHIDAPMHLTNNESFINEYSLERFIGNGCLLDCRNESIITFKDEYEKIVKENDIVLIYTAHSDKYDTTEYYENHPIIDENLAGFFIKKNIKMLGMDLPSPDFYPFQIHKKLFQNNIFIIENLTNLDSLLNINQFEIIALPLNIKAEASIARVIARTL